MRALDGGRGLIAVAYRLLNREGRWLGFDHPGLEVGDDGVLRLEALPAPSAPVAPAAVPAPPAGPAGIVRMPRGDVYLSDPDAHRLARVDGCDGGHAPVPCLGGPGAGPDQLDTPRGLLDDRRRDALLVADSGNGRIVVLSLPALETIEIWRLGGRPQSLARGEAGDIYVADPARDRVDRLDRDGRPVPGFWRLPGVLPAEVAAAGGRVYVLDRAHGRVHVLTEDGAFRGWWETGATEPVGFAACGDRIYVGDGAGRVLAFTTRGTLVGAANGYTGPVAALACAGADALLVHPGGEGPPLRFAARGACRRSGLVTGGPFPNPTLATAPWHLVRAAVDGDGLGGHLQLFVALQPAGAPRPPVDETSDEPFAAAPWQPVAPDAAETLLAGAFGDALSLGMTFRSDGLASPALRQVRVDFDHPTYLDHLPELYQRDAGSRATLARWLTLFESAFDEVRGEIEALPRLFDPAAAPADRLAWLAGWLALEVADGWDEAGRRRAIAGGFARAACRGTVAGVREALRSEAGVEAVLEEPIVQTGWWALADDGAPEAQAALSVLGAGTVLAAAEPQGAVVGTTAVLDGSFLSPQEDYATPLFTDVAHQFTVRVYRGPRYSDAALARVRAVLDRERPAHTAYHLCVIEPCLRVGVQARVGIDAIVAGGSAAAPLGPGDLVLAGEPPGRIGRTARLGRTYLTDTDAPSKE